MKNNATKRDAEAVTTKAIVAPNRNQMIPVNELANKVQILWNPVKNPIAVAVSSF